MRIIEKHNKKMLMSPFYNYLFDRGTGAFYRWGKTLKDDPDFSPYGTEIMDIEISSGECSGNCAFCYKKNGSGVPTKNMSLETFKEIFRTFPPTLTQIAFGITDIDTNPDFFEIMEYSRENGVVPNYTTNGKFVNDEVARKTAKLCGAVAVSMYDKDQCYNAVQLFVDAGMEQVNIHFMLSNESIWQLQRLIDDVHTDERLKGLKAIVLLQYKPHGRGITRFKSVKVLDYKNIIKYAEEKKVGLGFDSCSAPMYFKAIEDDPQYKNKTMYAEPCESGLFSFYMNVDGEYFPCSFAEGEPGWEKGLPYKEFESFMHIWDHPRILEWRTKLILSSQKAYNACGTCKSMSICRSCPLYPEVTKCKTEPIFENGLLPKFIVFDDILKKE